MASITWKGFNLYTFNLSRLENNSLNRTLESSAPLISDSAGAG